MNNTTGTGSIFKGAIAFLALFFIGTSVFGQETQATINEEEAEKKFRVAFGLGHAYIPQASSEGSSFSIIPTIGLDLQYWFGEKWGIALKSDVEIADYVLKESGEEGETIERETPVILSLPILFRPFDNELEFMLGPGIELESNENFSILRIGVGYEFELGNDWDFSPEVLYDLKNSNINSFALAFGVGKKF